VLRTGLSSLGPLALGSTGGTRCWQQAEPDVKCAGPGGGSGTRECTRSGFDELSRAESCAHNEEFSTALEGRRTQRTSEPLSQPLPRRERSFATGLEARRTGWRNKKPRLSLPAQAGFCCEKSGDTYSRAFGTTIGPESLTAVFEMGTGVTFRICSPERNRRRGKASAGSYTNGCGNWRSFGLERVLSQSTWRDFIAKERQSV
jgi:hypothetical protein